MNSKRMYYLMCGVLTVLVLAIVGSAYLANGMFQKRSAVLADLKVQNEVLSQERLGLTRAKKDIAKYESLEKIAKSIVPQDKDQAETVREIVKLASDSGIKPSSITFPASTLGTGIGATTGTGSATTVKPSSSAASLTQLTPVKGIPGLYVMPITISQTSDSPVPYPQFIAFLERLEQNRRTAQVSNIVLQPSPTDQNVLSYTLTVEKYIKP